MTTPDVQAAVGRLESVIARTFAGKYAGTIACADDLRTILSALATAEARQVELEDALKIAAWRFRYAARLMSKDPAASALSPSFEEAATDIDTALTPTTKEPNHG